MPGEPTTPDLEKARAALAAMTRGDFDAAASLLSQDSVWDASAQGVGIYEGRDAIRGLLEDWTRAYDEYEQELEELSDLGHGVSFGVLLQRGRPRGSTGVVTFRNGHVTIWRDGLIVRHTVYGDPDEARAAAERLAKERG